MAVLRDTFIRKYTQAIREGNAGIFAELAYQEHQDMWIGKTFCGHWQRR